LANQPPPAPADRLTRLLHSPVVGVVPLMVAVAWWIGQDAVLFVVSVLFPLLVAVQALMPAPGAGAADKATAAAPDRADAAADPLTGLPPRDAALARLAAFLTSVRTTGKMCAILVIDIDRFRHVNERFGIDAGDAILKVAAARISEAIRAEDVATRIAGDRFAVVLSPLARAEFENVMATAGRLRDALAAPIPLDQTELHLTVSIGLCLAGRAPENTAPAMLQAAEEAMVEARRNGRGAIANYSPRMRRESRKHRALSADLDAALVRGEFKAWFQPQIDAQTGAPAGFEALARWEHPDEGILTPDRFLRALAAAEAEPRLGEAMLAQSLTALKAWDKAELGVPGVAINLSTNELRDTGFCDRLKWETDRHEVDPCRVAIEIKESLLGPVWDTAGDADADADGVARNLHGLKDFGFRLDLDDFGTGRASIATICRFRTDRIKIDRSFVAGMETDAGQRAAVAGIIRLATTLGIEAIAEGVESPAETALLAEMGCACVQGFAVARPMPAAKVPGWIESYGRSLKNRPPRSGTGTG
jgi:diguanylate cyclase (GGDEF)-like protein